MLPKKQFLDGRREEDALMFLANVLGITVSAILSGREDSASNETIKEIIEYIDESKRKKNTIYFLLSMLLYLATLFCHLLYLKRIYTSSMPYYDYKGGVLFYILFSALILFANSLLANYYDRVEDRGKIKKLSSIFLFLLYIVMVFNLTIFGRTIGETRYNLLLFQTIKEYIFDFSSYNINVVMINIFGNLAIFMPIQFFILKLFSFKQFKIIFLTDFLFVFMIESLQYFTYTGIFEVDDIFLNLLGMVLVSVVFYFFERIKKSKKNIKKNDSLN